jgi:hypothetical protein
MEGRPTPMGTSNRMLKRIFASKREKVTGVIRKLHIEELHNLYSMSNSIKIMKPKKMN